MAKHSAKPRFSLFGILCSVLCLLLAAAVAVQVCLNIHPIDIVSAPVVTAEEKTQTADLSLKMEQFSNNTASTALDGLTYIPKIYTIDEDALSGYLPDETLFGATDDPAVLTEVLKDAETLLDGQSLSWNPDLELRPNSLIRWYLDDTILVICWQEVHNSAVYNYAEVKIAHPSQFRRTLAGNAYGASLQLPCTAMAAASNAVLAANADFYAFRGTGVNIYRGTLYRCDGRILDTCYIDENGDLLYTKAGEITEDAQAQQIIDEHGVKFSLSFGPVIVEDGVPITSCSYPIGEVNEIYARSAIGQLGKLHYLVMTAGSAGDGSPYRNSAYVVDVAAEMANKNCISAYTLDGGQTAEIVFGGEIFNRVVYDSERAVSDIIYFATAIPDGRDG